MRNNLYRHYLILIIWTTTLLVGCATIPSNETDLRESLRAEAVKYWDMRMKDMYEETYKMEHRDELPTYTEYINKAMMIKKANITSHLIKDVHIEGDRGVVDVEFSFIMPPVTKPFKQVMTDEWVYKGGRWWHRLQ